jgi:hypothetical protein
MEQEPLAPALDRGTRSRWPLPSSLTQSHWAGHHHSGGARAHRRLLSRHAVLQETGVALTIEHTKLVGAVMVFSDHGERGAEKRQRDARCALHEHRTVEPRYPFLNSRTASARITRNRRLCPVLRRYIRAMPLLFSQMTKMSQTLPERKDGRPAYCSDDPYGVKPCLSRVLW